MKTAQTNELPAVWLLSDSSKMGSAFKTCLNDSGFQTVDRQVEKNAYKNLLVLTGKTSGSSLQHQLDELASSPRPTIVVVPILDSVEDSGSAHWKTAYQASQWVLQTIVARLPAAKLVLVRGWVSHSLDVWFSQPTLCAVGVSSLINRMPTGVLYPIETTEVVKLVVSYVSQPHSGHSVVLRGSPVSTTQFVGEVIKFYESYYHTSVELVVDGEISPNSPPFAHQEVVVSMDSQELARTVARSLPTPGQQAHPGLFDWGFLQPAANHGVVDDDQKESNELSSGRVSQKSDGTHQPNPSRDDLMGFHPDKLFTQLDTLFVDRRAQAKTTRVKSLAAHEKRGGKKNHRRKSFFWLGVVSSGIAMVILAVASTFLISSSLLRRGFYNQVELLAVETTSQVGLGGGGGGDLLAWFVQWQLAYLNQLVDSPRLEETQLVLLAEQHLTAVAELSRRQHELQSTVVAHLIGANPADLSEVISDLSLITNRRLTELGELKAALDYMVVDRVWWPSAVEKLENTIENQRKQSTYLTQLLPIIPGLLGVDEPRTYALLFLDSSEIRPTGGFVQAVATITIENGRISASRVLSSYEIDEKLGGLVEPPAELARVLGEDAWYFRDSNWDADHNVAAERVAWFLDKSMGLQLDGVISIPSPAFAYLLEAIGSVSVPDFNETVTADNLSERLLFYNEANATSTKQSFSVALLQSFIAGLSTQTESSTTELIHAFVTQLEGANVQISLFNPTENEPLQALRWTGSLVKPTCPPQFAGVPCSIDYIYQVESNVGVNKVNPSVSRKIEHMVSLENELATHQRTTVLKNNAKSNAWPQGSYKAYIKWLLPSGAQLSSITIDGSRVGQDLVFSTTEHNLASYAVLVDVPIQSERVVVVSYRSPLSTTLPHSYLLFDQKQPGLSTSNHLVEIRRADEGQPIRVAPEPQVVDSNLLFEFDRSSHSLVLVEYN